MNIRWTAVLTGFVVDALVSTLIVILTASDDAFRFTPDLRRADHLTTLGLIVLSAGVGGYVAGRMARERYALHGLLVGVVAILIGQIDILNGGTSPHRIFVLASAIRCLVGALGGLIGRFLPPHSPPQPRQ